MSKPIAVVDTCAILLVVGPSRAATEPDFRRRQTNATACFERLSDSGVRFVVPAPVVAELCGDGLGTELVTGPLLQFLKNVRLQDFTDEMADHAGTMRRASLRTRSNEGREVRGVIDYDALIAATAHHLDAKYLVTSNVKDFQRHLRIMQSSVSILDPTEIAQGQTAPLPMVRR